MSLIYIIGGLIFMAGAIYTLDKREKLTIEKKRIEQYKKEIQNIHNELDEISVQLNQQDAPIRKVHQVSSKILEYMK